VLSVLIATDTNSHGQPLHHFDKVATGIVGRQEGEQRPRGAGEIFDCALVIATEGIHKDAHGLTRAHVLKLGFLEICGDPDIVEGNDGK
jgi:hypothetical protein